MEIYSNLNEYVSRVQLLQFFYFNKYEATKFDRDFLWTNFDSNGKELLYCTEMIVKLLNDVLHLKIQPEPMSFDKNIKFWRKYYQGPPPHNQPGVSPGVLERTSLMKEVGVF